MILEIDGTPPSLNKWMRMHWTQQRLMKHEWAWLVKEAVLKAKVGSPMWQYATVKITLVFPILRRRDLDNFTPKWINDSLVQCGLIMDDRDDWVKVSWSLTKGDKRKTIIEVTEIDRTATE